LSYLPHGRASPSELVARTSRAQSASHQAKKNNVQSLVVMKEARSPDIDAA
jgi:hypothetical protein